MDRQAYLNEDFGSSDDYCREKQHYNYFQNEEVDPDEELEEMPENELVVDNDNGNEDEQAEQIQKSNDCDTPGNLQHLSAPKFAPISQYGKPVNSAFYNQEEEPVSDEEEELNDRLESYSKNNQYSPRHYEDLEGTNNNHSQSKMSFNSRLLDCRSNRKKVELDVQALANRVALLENEEKKLLGKIDETKRKALEIMHIKKNAKVHQEILSEKMQREQFEKHKNKEKAQQQKNELKERVEVTKRYQQEKTLSKAESVKQNLANLRNEYAQRKIAEKAENIYNVNNIKNFEKELEMRKREKQEEIAYRAKERYNKQIELEENQTTQYLDHIEKLENKEKSLIERLKITQTQHQMVIDDLERIHENGKATGPLADLSKDFNDPKGMSKAFKKKQVFY